jgi:flavin reductase (DIM6/NTAB) family NADH-FMN oxidoreductase RutF
MSSAHAIQPAEPGLDDRSLRVAFGRFATGVAFVTADVDGAPLGLIVSSFAAVSLQPPLVSFCPSRHSITWQRMRHTGRCTINVLGARHGNFARRAAAPGADRFAEPDVIAMRSRRSNAISPPSIQPEITGSSSAVSAGSGSPPTANRSCTSPAASATSNPTDAIRNPDTAPPR